MAFLGIKVTIPNGPTTARARLLMCSVDLPEKAIILNTKQFNRKYGCPYCEDEGVARAATHLHRNWPYSSSSSARTHGSIIANALQNGAPVSWFTHVPILFHQ